MMDQNQDIISPFWSSESIGEEGPQSKNQINITETVVTIMERYMVIRELISRELKILP